MKNEIREEWRELYKAKKGILNVVLLLAEKIVENESLEVQLSELDESVFTEEVLTDSIFILTEDKLSFRNEELLVLAYSESVIKEYLLPNWDDPLLMLNILRDRTFSLHKLTTISHLETEVLILLAKHYDKNILELAIRLVYDDNSFWVVQDHLIKSLKEINFTAADFLAYYTHAIKVTGGVFGYTTPLFLKIGETNPVLSQDVYDTFISIDGFMPIDFLKDLIIGASHKDFKSSHDKAVQLCSSKDPKEIRVGIETLGGLDYKGEENAIKRSISELQKHRKSDNKSILHSLLRATSNLLPNENQLGEWIKDFSKYKEEIIHREIIQVLSINDRDFYREGWFKDCLRNLMEKGSGLDFNRIDFLISKYVVEDPGFVEEMFQLWIQNFSANGNLDITKNLTSTWASMRNNQQRYIQSLMLRLFNSDNFEFHNAASQLVASYSTYDDNDELQDYLVFDPQLVYEWEYKDIVFIIYKVLGFVLDSNFLCSLTFSLLSSKDSKEVMLLIEEAFIDVILYDYPNRVDFLETKVKTGTSLEKQVAKKCLKVWNSYFDEFKELEKLNELRPSIERLRINRIQERKKRKEFGKEVKRSSILLQLVTEVPLKFGKGMASFQNEEISDVSYLGNYAKSYSLPRSSIISPTQYSNLRNKWRSIERSEL